MLLRWVTVTCSLSRFHLIFGFAYALGYVCHLPAQLKFSMLDLDPVQLKGETLKEKQKWKEWKESEKPRNEIAKSCSLISLNLFWTDSHSDRCHRNVNTSPLLFFMVKNSRQYIVWEKASFVGSSSSRSIYSLVVCFPMMILLSSI